MEHTNKPHYMTYCIYNNCDQTEENNTTDIEIATQPWTKSEGEGGR